MENPFYAWVFAVLTCVLFSSCAQKAFEERLGKQVSETSDLTAKMLDLGERKESYDLRWEEALTLMEERNIQYLRTKQRVEDIKKQRDEQWKTWLPQLSAFANINRSLTELGKLSFSDLSVSVIAPLNIPNPLTERARAFENALSYVQAVDSAKLSYRRQVINLYRIYSRVEDLERRRIPSESGEIGSPATALSDLRNRTMNESSLRTLQGQLVQILNVPGSQPYPVAKTRPALDYSDEVFSFIPGRNYGALACRLAAYRIEGALLREKGIKLRRWPTLTLAASTPALYDNRSESDFQVLDSDRINLFGGLTKSYNFTGTEADRVESAEQNTEFVKQELRLQLDSDGREWHRLQDRYQEIVLQRKIAEERLDQIKSDGSIGSVSKQLTRVREALVRVEGIKQVKEQLDLEIWLWDDSAWN